MNENNDFDFERFKAEAIKGMYGGKPLNGGKGIFVPMLKHFLESILAMAEPSDGRRVRATPQAHGFRAQL